MLGRRATFIVLIAFLTAATAVSMEALPRSPSPDHGQHHSRADLPAGQGNGHHDGPAHCLYCQLAKAMVLPSGPGVLVVPRRGRMPKAAPHPAPCVLRSRLVPCQPRAPPGRSDG